MAVTQRRMTTEEIVGRGEEWYNAGIRERVEPDNKGKFLALDVDTGDYQIDSDEHAALKRALAANPDGLFYLIRVGFEAAHYFGASMTGISL